MATMATLGQTLVLQIGCDQVVHGDAKALEWETNISAHMSHGCQLAVCTVPQSLHACKELCQLTHLDNKLHYHHGILVSSGLLMKGTRRFFQRMHAGLQQSLKVDMVRAQGVIVGRHVSKPLLEGKQCFVGPVMSYPYAEVTWAWRTWAVGQLQWTLSYLGGYKRRAAGSKGDGSENETRQ